MNCKLIGQYVKHLEIVLMAGEEFYAEKGALIYLDEGIDMRSELNGNSLGSIIGSKLSGESLMIVRYYNPGPGPRRLVVGSQAGIMHFKLEGRELICRKGAYLCSSAKMNVSTRLSIRGFVGGIGALLQRVAGVGTVFLETHGDPVVINLAPGQKIRIDENHFLAFDGITEDRISPCWNLSNLFGGEGWSLLSVSGPGTVYLNPGVPPVIV